MEGYYASYFFGMSLRQTQNYKQNYICSTYMQPLIYLLDVRRH